MGITSNTKQNKNNNETKQRNKYKTQKNNETTKEEEKRKEKRKEKKNDIQALKLQVREDGFSDCNYVRLLSAKQFWC